MTNTHESSHSADLAGRHRARWDRAVAVALLLGFLGLYHVNGGFLPGRDATANLYLPVRILEAGRLSFTPETMPWMFRWTLDKGDAERVVSVSSWQRETGLGGAATWGDLRDRGRLSLRQPEYFLVPSIDPQRRGYVNQYGPGAGLTALPLLAALWLFAGDLAGNAALVWYGGKFVAALCVAGSVALVFLTLRSLVDRSAALAIAVAYGAGTCVWSVASQSLWQSGPNILFISLAAYCLLRIERSAWWAAGCGAAAAWGVVCRPTTAVLVLAIGAYLAALAVHRLRNRSKPTTFWKATRPLLAYVAAGLPPAVALAAYNWYYLGSPLRFGQTEAGRRLAEAQLGSADAWGGSFFEGFYGLLISPSRGLLVYSPILLLAVWGTVRVWRDPRFERLRPLSVSVLVLLLVQAKWFSWHGGWSFGYRLMVDAAPLLALCAAAVIETVWRRKALLAMCGVLLAWSIGVQVIGAFAYNVVGWNHRKALLVERPGDDRPLVVFDSRVAAEFARDEGATVRAIGLDVDRRCHHHRLWSVTDSQLVYYLTHFAEARDMKKRLIESVTNPP